MRRIVTKLAMITLIAALPGLAAFALPHAADAGTVINLQAGVTGANSSSDATDITDSARLGYAFGGNLRMGGMGYFAPGAYYQRTSLKHTDRSGVSLPPLTDDLSVNSLYLPLKFGLSLASPGVRSFGLRAYAGPAATIITDVKPNTFGITKDDYNKTTWGAEVGAGLDFSTLTFDASYEKGLSNEFKTGDTKRNVIRGVFGVKL